MPIFPFDDTKFYALTHMLDVLGRKTAMLSGLIWEHKGFIPEKAYAIIAPNATAHTAREWPCGHVDLSDPEKPAQCGIHAQPDKEDAIDSITHGVKGVRRWPPWGETPKDKENYDGIPVITKDEIGKLADWLYSSIPGGAQEQEVPKWHYAPEDVIKEMENEGLIP